jgi:hypothetical protein
MKRLGKDIEITPSSSEGPILVTIDVPKKGVVVTDNGTGRGIRKLPLRITIKNIGNGLVKCGEKLGCIDKLILKVQTEGDEITPTCSGATVDETSDPLTLTFEKIDMIGDTAYVSCTLNIDVDLGARPDFEKTYTLYAVATYDYQIEAETSVTVRGSGI